LANPVAAYSLFAAAIAKSNNTDADLQHQFSERNLAKLARFRKGMPQNSKPAQTIFAYQAIFQADLLVRKKTQVKANEKALRAGLSIFFNVARGQRVLLLRFICAWKIFRCLVSRDGGFCLRRG
jgi:Na+/phosphate symporter